MPDRSWHPGTDFETTHQFYRQLRLGDERIGQRPTPITLFLRGP